jgi:hypothetical protein
MNTGPRWEVRIEGDARDLQALSRYAATAQIAITQDKTAPTYRLHSDKFESLPDARAVFDAANEILEILSGALVLTSRLNKPLSSGPVYRHHDDGTDDVSLFVHEAVTVVVSETAEVHATGEVRDSAGMIRITPAPPPPFLFTQLGLVDPAIAKALSLLAKPNALTWVGLYRIYEVIEHDVGGEKKMVRRGWGSAHQQKRFKHSANSVAVGGDEARHGKEITIPPKDPMSLLEAEAYCRYLLQTWIHSKQSANVQAGASP